MSSRATKFVSALFVTWLAGAAFVTTSHGAPAEGEKCLSGPKGAAPAGGHWYYRVDRATKRNCWYVGDARGKAPEKPARAGPVTARTADNAAPPPNNADTPPAIANARAELPLPQPRVGQETSVFTAPRPLATVSGAISPDTPRAKADETGTAQAVVASRWVLADAASSGTAPSTDNTAAKAPASSRAAASTPPKAAPMPALPLATADAPSSERQTGSVQMLLIAIVAALALAGLLASAIFRFGGARHRGKRTGQRVNWDSVRSDRPSLSDAARARTADNQDERIAQLLGKPPRTAT